MDPRVVWSQLPVHYGWTEPRKSSIDILWRIWRHWANILRGRNKMWPPVRQHSRLGQRKLDLSHEGTVTVQCTCTMKLDFLDKVIWLLKSCDIDPVICPNPGRESAEDILELNILNRGKVFYFPKVENDILYVTVRFRQCYTMIFLRSSLASCESSTFPDL